MIIDVWYQTDWQISVPHLNSTSAINFFNTNLTQIPDGHHIVTVFATGAGNYVDSNNTFYIFEIVGNSSVSFSVDSVLPTVSLPYAQNQTFATSTLILNFTTNKAISQVIYSLDNHVNATTTDNSTLTLKDLANGPHNLTVYSKDAYDVISDPSILYFNIERSSPIFAITVALSIIVIIAVASVVLVIYRKHRNLAK